jgi:hypothetical protein
MCFGWRLHRDQLFGHDPLRGRCSAVVFWGDLPAPAEIILSRPSMTTETGRSYGSSKRFLMFSIVIYCVFYDISKQTRKTCVISMTLEWKSPAIGSSWSATSPIAQHILKAPLLKWSGDSGTTPQLSRSGDRHWGPEPLAPAQHGTAWHTPRISP